MLRLLTFGGLRLEGLARASGAELRPRSLALLAILAAGRGVSRDRIQAILWPDSDAERARHALSQILYSLRQELGVEPVLAGRELRLDPRVISSDAGEFLEAVERGESERAVGLYVGPFLDGFYLVDASEFERWAEEERGRFLRMTLEALEKLGRNAEAAGAADAARGWWERLVRLDPLSARFAVGYMRALAGAGDRAGALAHARQYESVLKRELDAEPDPEVVSLVGQLRRGERIRGPAPSVAEPTELPAPSPMRAEEAPPATRRPIRLLVGLGAIGLALAAWAGWRLSRPTVPDSPPILAVGFISEVAIPDSAPGGRVLADMIATSLGRVAGLQVVANSRLFELMRPGSDTAPSAYLLAARNAGAEEILEGVLRPAAQGFLLELQRVDVRRGVVRQGYRVSATDLYALSDSVTAAIAGDFRLASPREPLAGVMTPSPVAYRLYEEGLRAYYQYDVAAALRLMQAAVAEDSTFAMAVYYQWLAARFAQPDSLTVYLQRALRVAEHAGDRERLLILCSAAANHNDPRSAAAADTLAVRFPNDPEALSLVGEVRFVQGDWAASAQAYERAIALDSAAPVAAQRACRLCNSFHYLQQAYMWWDSVPAAERTVRRWIRLRQGDASPWENLADVLVRLGRPADARDALRRADSLRHLPRDLSEMALHHLLLQEAFDEADRRALADLAAPTQERRGEGRWLLLISLRYQGRLREAMALVNDGILPGAGARIPQEGDPHNAAILAFESGRATEAARQYLLLRRSTSPFAGEQARALAWGLTLAATAHAAAGDTAAVRRLADSVDQVGHRSLYGRDRRLPSFLRGLLLARQGRHLEAIDAYRRAVHSWTFGYTRINLELGRSYLALDRPAEAISALSSALRGGVDGSNLYVTRTELHELLAHAWDRAGQPDSAAAHYHAVVRAWRRADPLFEPRAKAAKAWLARQGRTEVGG